MLKTMKLNKLKQIIKEEIQKLQTLNEAEEYVGGSFGAAIFCDNCPCGCIDVITNYQPAGGGDATYAKCKSPCTNQDTTSGAAKIVDPRYRNPMSKKPTRLREAEEAIIEMINEKLCKKGKAYIAKRKRAGEKSSAYLSGRAVKVCKGQMKG